MSAVLAHDADAWRGQLERLLPSGPAWAVPADGTMDNLLAALADEFARADGRITALLDEADPRTALELLGNWETTAGLPDSCTGTPDSLDERRTALAQKIAEVGGQSRAYFTALAGALGYATTIEELGPARIGDRIGARVGGTEWSHVWRVHVSLDAGLPNARVARVGDRIGVRLRGWGSIDLECVIRRHAPAHTIVLFSYEE